MNIWLHRISYFKDESQQLLKHNYISTGLSEFSNENSLKFKEKDLIIIPKYSKFSIYEIIGEPFLLKDVPNLDKIFNQVTVKEDNKVYIKNKQIDLGFVWKCKVIVENVSKKDVFDKSLISRMKIRQTNLDITDLKESVENIIKLHNSYKSYNIHSDIINHVGVRVEDIISESLNPIKFKKLIKLYLEKSGASCVDIYENKSDADVIATFENLKIIIYIEGKYQKGYSSDLSVNEIIEFKNQILNMDDEYNYIPWIITSSEQFKPEVIQKGKELQIRLINISEFVKMLIDSGFENINDAFM